MISLALLAPEQHVPAAPPLIDMDWTILVQFGIFLTMAAVLYTFVFKPYLAVQDERARRIDGAKKDARSMQERAAAMMADYDARLLQAKQKGAEERLKVRAEGQAYEREVVEKARAVGQKALDEARQRAAVQRQAAEQQLLVDAQQIGRQIAGRILGRQG